MASSPVMEAAQPQQALPSPTKKPRASPGGAAPGEFCSLTKLLGQNFPITQDIFTRTISRPGVAPKDVCTLFEFYRPVKRPSAMTSSILRLTDKQHDVLYALSGCADVACTMSKVDKKTRKALLHVYGIDKTQFSTWFKNRRPKPRKDGSRREITIPVAPAGSEAPMAGSCDTDLLVEPQHMHQRQHPGAPGQGGSWAGSLSGAHAPGLPEHDGMAPQMSLTGGDRKRRPSACSRQNSPVKAARSPSSAATDSLPRLLYPEDMAGAGHDAHMANVHTTYADPVPNQFLPHARHLAHPYHHQQYHGHAHQSEQHLQPVYEGSYAPTGTLPRVNTAPGPHVFRQPQMYNSRSWDHAQATAAAQGMPIYADLPEWPESPTASAEKRNQQSSLVLSQSAIAAVAADAAAAAEEASGLLPVQMRGRSFSYPGGSSSGAASFSVPQPGFLQQQRAGAGYPAPAHAGAAASKMATYHMRVPGGRATMPGYGSDLPHGHATHYSKASLGGFAPPSTWNAVRAGPGQPAAANQGVLTADADRRMAAGKPAAAPSWAPAAGAGGDRQRLMPYPSTPARWATEYPQWGGAVTSGATLRSPRGPVAVIRCSSMPFHDTVVDVKQEKEAAMDAVMTHPAGACISAPEHGVHVSGQGEGPARCNSPAWGTMPQQKACKDKLKESPDPTPLSIADTWPAESTAELEGFDLNAFGFLDELSME